MFISFSVLKVYRLLSAESLYLRIPLINFKCISRHLRGVKIKIFRGSIPPDSPQLTHLSCLPFKAPPPPPHPKTCCAGPIISLFSKAPAKRSNIVVQHLLVQQC